jgi:Tol biopolymer transport system component
MHTRAFCPALALVFAGVVLTGCSSDTGSSSDSDGARSCPSSRSVVAVNRNGEYEGLAEVVLVGANGAAVSISEDWVATEPSFSPDGDELVVVRAEGDYESAGPGATDLWVIDADGTSRHGVTEGAHASSPDWSPSGNQIVYSEFIDGYFELRTIAASGSSAPETLLRSDGTDRLAPAWSPDGSQVAFINRTRLDNGPEADPTEIEMIRSDGSDRQTVVEIADAHSIAWSPDGEQFLVSTFAAETGKILLVEVATGAAREIAEGATFATWTPDGAGIYYSTKDGSANNASWRLAEGHIEDGHLTRDRFMGPHSEYLYPYFGSSTRPCPRGA